MSNQLTSLARAAGEVGPEAAARAAREVGPEAAARAAREAGPEAAARTADDLLKLPKGLNLDIDSKIIGDMTPSQKQILTKYIYRISGTDLTKMEPNFKDALNEGLIQAVKGASDYDTFMKTIKNKLRGVISKNAELLKGKGAQEQIAMLATVTGRTTDDIKRYASNITAEILQNKLVKKMMVGFVGLAAPLVLLVIMSMLGIDDPLDATKEMLNLMGEAVKETAKAGRNIIKNLSWIIPLGIAAIILIFIFVNYN